MTLYGFYCHMVFYKREEEMWRNVPMEWYQLILVSKFTRIRSRTTETDNVNSLSQSIPSRHRESREQSRKCSLSTLDSLRPQFNLNIFVVSHLLNPASREILEEFIWRIELISSSLEIPSLSYIAASVDRLRPCASSLAFLWSCRDQQAPRFAAGWANGGWMSCQ